MTTLKGTGFSYRTFEPAAGGIHQGQGRERRVQAGLRYTNGGKGKYWLPLAGDESTAHGRKGKAGVVARPVRSIKQYLQNNLQADEGYAPLGAEDAREVVHADDGASGLVAGESEEYQEEVAQWKAREGREYGEDDIESEAESLGFGDGPDDEVEDLYQDSRRLEFGESFDSLGRRSRLRS